MNHTQLLKQAFHITWRYRPLWLFGFLLALCSGGSGGNSNFNPPSDSTGFEDILPNSGPMPEIDPGTVIGIIIAVFCLVLILALIGVVVSTVSRTALLGMVRQITRTEAVTVGDGFRFGWSKEAWRLFLVGLVIGIPVFIITLVLILLAMSPLLLLLINDSAGAIAGGVVLTIIAVLLMIVILMIIGAIVAPIQEISWRRAVLDGQGVIASVGDSFGIIRRNLKDVIIVVLLMMGVGLLWVFVFLLTVLPLSLLAAVVLGGLPAGLVYLISNSWLGAAVAGIPLAIIAMVLVISFGTGLFYVYQSTFWTLAYLELKKPGDVDLPTEAGLPEAKPNRPDEDFAPPHLSPEIDPSP